MARSEQPDAVLPPVQARDQYTAWAVKVTAKRIRERIDDDRIDDVLGVIALLKEIERSGRI